METDDLLREVIKGQKNMAEKFTKDLKDLAEDFVEKLTAQTKAIVTIRQDIKVIKDDIKNLTQRVDVTEKEF
jgi:polyhydroxyalkanoate synthesis regulator phasin